MGRGATLTVVCALLLCGAAAMFPGRGDAHAGRAGVGHDALPAEEPAALTVGAVSALVAEAPVGAVTLSPSRVRMPVPVEFTSLTGADCTGGALCLRAEASGATLTARSREDLPTEAACALEPGPGFETAVLVVSGSGDHVAARFTLESGAEVRSLSRLRHGGSCVELEARAVGETAAQARAVHDELAMLMAGVALPDGRSGLWAGGR